MIGIIPAIMPKSFVELEDRLARVAGLADTVQIDIMDGVFVAGTTWPYTENAQPVLPESSVQFEVDLMVANTEAVIDAWISAGAHRIIAHTESIKDFPAIRQKTRDANVELGLALNTDTHNDSIEEFVGDVDSVQFMGIATIGLQGEPFDERVLAKIRDFHKIHPDVTISVDGGVSPTTAPELVAAGASRLVSGSAIFTSDEPSAVVKTMQSL